MNFVYSILTRCFDVLLPLIGRLSPKLSLFAEGRKKVFDQLREHFPSSQPAFWIHCASLGEYEQGFPVIEAFKIKYPEYKIVITFFSPSGFEVKKNSKLADVIVYLPIDTKRNAKRFIELISPQLALFVKYEFWPNFLSELKRNAIPVILISGVFRKEQVFFKWYGGLMRKALRNIDHFFVQDTISKELIESLHHSNVTLSGDTRFDRVSQQIRMDNTVGFLETFVNQRLCLVLGSTWPEDEPLFVEYINNAPDNVCFIIAPHEVKDSTVQRLKNMLNEPVIAYSEMEGKNVRNHSVFVLNTIGYLSKAYYYADVAYVGGAMGNSGLHNILEPATFGIPVLIGNNFEKFREAKELQRYGGLFSVSTAGEFADMATKLIENKSFRQKTGMIAGHFINNNKGATEIILSYIHKLLADPEVR